MILRSASGSSGSLSQEDSGAANAGAGLWLERKPIREIAKGGRQVVKIGAGCPVKVVLGCVLGCLSVLLVDCVAPSA